MPNSLRNLIVAIGLAIAPIVVATPAAADQPATYTAPFSNVGASGYDVVAYFTDGRPVRGAQQFRTTHNGTEYRFASAEHLALFQAAPARYLPQFGGYCAWAVSQGYTASADPRQWRVVDGKLYLNYNAEIQQRWAQDVSGNISRGNANWPSVLRR